MPKLAIQLICGASVGGLWFFGVWGFVETIGPFQEVKQRQRQLRLQMDDTDWLKRVTQQRQRALRQEARGVKTYVPALPGDAMRDISAELADYYAEFVLFSLLVVAGFAILFWPKNLA